MSTDVLADARIHLASATNGRRFRVIVNDVPCDVMPMSFAVLAELIVAKGKDEAGGFTSLRRVTDRSTDDVQYIYTLTKRLRDALGKCGPVVSVSYGTCCLNGELLGLSIDRGFWNSPAARWLEREYPVVAADLRRLVSGRSQEPVSPLSLARSKVVVLSE